MVTVGGGRGGVSSGVTGAVMKSFSEEVVTGILFLGFRRIAGTLLKRRGSDAGIPLRSPGLSAGPGVGHKAMQANPADHTQVAGTTCC